MKATKIYYQRTTTYPGYHNKSIGIEIMLEDGEKAADVLHKAEIFVANGLNEKLSSEKMEDAIKSAFETIRKQEKDELPF